MAQFFIIIIHNYKWEDREIDTARHDASRLQHFPRNNTFQKF